MLSCCTVTLHIYTLTHIYREAIKPCNYIVKKTLYLNIFVFEFKQTIRMKYLLVLLLPLLSSFSFPHDLHISKGIVAYNSEAQTLEISLNLFLDDLELGIEEEAGHANLKLCTPKEIPEGETYMADYFKNHFQLLVDGELADFKFVSKEPTADYQAAWCYLVVEQVESFSSLTIKNTLLIELFDDQQNIVELKVNKKRMGFFLFDRKNQEEEIALQ